MFFAIHPALCGSNAGALADKVAAPFRKPQLECGERSLAPSFVEEAFRAARPLRVLLCRQPIYRGPDDPLRAQGLRDSRRL
jgi:hypothetical protein